MGLESGQLRGGGEELAIRVGTGGPGGLAGYHWPWPLGVPHCSGMSGKKHFLPPMWEVKGLSPVSRKTARKSQGCDPEESEGYASKS